MTNIERAEETIERAMGEIALGYPGKPQEIAEALADAGFLTPDPQIIAEGEIGALKGRLESVLSRLEYKWDTKLHPDTCTAEQQNAALDITTTIRKELEQ